MIKVKKNQIISFLKETAFTSLVNGSGYGSSDSSNDGYDLGSGSSNGSGYGSGYGSGSGFGSGFCYGSGSGYGYCSGYGDSNGSGDGSGDSDDDVKALNGFLIVSIDCISTIVYHIKGDVLKGGILNKDQTITPCYVVKKRGLFAHGESIKLAFKSLKEKVILSKTEQERIQDFVKNFKSDRKYKVENLSNWHWILTGSCEYGRNHFLKENNISLSDKVTVNEFINKTIKSYRGDIIEKLKIHYKNES